MRPLLTLTIAIALILLVAPTRGGAMDFTALGNAPGEEYFLYFNLAKLPPKPQVVFFDFRDSSNYRVLNLEQDKLSLAEQVDGKWKTLDSTKIAPTAAGSLVIKRHSSYAAAVLNGETVVSGPVAKALGDVYGTGSEGECTVAFQRCQQLDKVIFADSFMRTDSPGEWEIESGFWEICGLSFSEQSANPFSLFCRFASSGALEEPSDDRIYEDRIGIGVAMDPRGHISRIAGQAPAADAGLQQDDIIETINGQPVALNWNRLETARVGEKFVLQIRRGGNRFTVAVVARRYRWGEIEKRFPLQPATLAPLAMIRAGFPFWDDYTFRASVRPMGEGMAGLAFYVTDAQNYYAFRWWGDNSLRKGRTNTLELVRVRGGVEEVLASADGGFYPDQYYEMKVRIAKDAIECQIDGAVVFTQSYPKLASGSVALIAADGYGVYFDDVRVASTDIYADPPRKRRVNEVFSRQGDMRDWADPIRDWTTRFVRGGNAIFFSKYHVFGGADLIIHPEADFIKLDVTAFADDDYKGGTQITLDEKGSVEVISGIAANRDSIKGTVKLDRTIPIVIRCDRNTVAVLQSDRRLFEARTPSAPKGSFFVVKGLRSLMANGSQVIELSGGNIRDYTFEESPTDWFVVDGKWGVTNKWICDPRWSDRKSVV